jgi:hypothetical protein
MLKIEFKNFFGGTRDYIRTSCLIGRCSTTWAMLSALFCFSYFWYRVLLYAWASWPMILLFTLFPIASMTVASCPVFIGWDRVSWTFCLGWSQTSILLISTFWITGITGMRHHAWLKFKHFKDCCVFQV